jgi:hypothetical protein
LWMMLCWWWYTTVEPSFLSFANTMVDIYSGIYRLLLKSM